MTVTFGKMAHTAASGGYKSAGILKNGKPVGYVEQLLGRERGEGVVGYMVFFEYMDNPFKFMVGDYRTARKALAAAKEYARQVATDLPVEGSTEAAEAEPENTELDMTGTNELAKDLLETCPGCGSYYDPELGETACCEADLGSDLMRDERRIANAVEAGLKAFWKEVHRRFPEAENAVPDFPDFGHRLAGHKVGYESLRAWLKHHLPGGGGKWSKNYAIYSSDRGPHDKVAEGKVRFHDPCSDWADSRTYDSPTYGDALEAANRMIVGTKDFHHVFLESAVLTKEEDGVKYFALGMGS